MVNGLIAEIRIIYCWYVKSNLQKKHWKGQATPKIHEGI